MKTLVIYIANHNGYHSLFLFNCKVRNLIKNTNLIISREEIRKNGFDFFDLAVSQISFTNIIPSQMHNKSCKICVECLRALEHFKQYAVTV